MPMLLSRIQAQNEVWLNKLPPSATRFRGVIFPVNPTALPTSVFILPRLGLRTRPREPVHAKDLFRDPAGRVMLVGNWELPLALDDVVSRCFVLFQMTGKVSWRRRSQAVKHPVTGLPQSEGPFEEVGPIWVSIESYTHGNEDPGARITTDRLRCITNAPLQYGDMVNGKTVKRLNPTLGVTIAEIE
ncbi:MULTISPECIES: hypothetical protein [unclassified Methylobacterium]|uniref:hypothetical protein n=1 Tax=unclassified Methylobacterium TaxID=2615210 RepID=UPI0011C1FBDF|nr:MULTISPECIES: hypothetical protein [unclassified Methylobacterium]QEE37925.1 hypothetical protein FVA80_02070 [Methylobacterium sp. WL1]TXN59369.1 hypothetical protein FV241_02340 [Methylobacterium sp. WL2]